MDFLIEQLLTEALLESKRCGKTVDRWENIDQKGRPVEGSGLAENELGFRLLGISFGLNFCFET